MKRTLLLLFIVTFKSFAYTQDTTDNWSINQLVYNLQEEINALNFKYNGSKEKNFSNEVNAKIFELKVFFDENYLKFLQINDSDLVYKKSLSVDYKSLKSLSFNKQTLEDLLDDIHAKSNSFDLGLNQNEANYIPVEVTTYDSALNKISGYYIYWNFWLDKDNLNPYTHFNQFTNPTSSELLIPAVYDIWVQKPGDSKQYPPKNTRVKNIIFLNNGEKIKVISIVIR